MSNLASSFDLYDSAYLCNELARIHRPQTNGELCVGVLVGEQSTAVAIDSSGKADRCGSGASRGPLGCVAKVLTGTLALRAATEGLLNFDSDLSEVDEPLLCSQNLRTTVRQLLSHSHGLDLSHVERIGLTSTGHIDVNALSCSLTDSPRLFEAGTLYSYSNTGSWVTAALLEKAYSGRFAELLVSKLLRPAGIDIVCDNPETSFFCAATGGDLWLSVPELLQFFHWLFEQDALRQHAELRVTVGPPGWCLERGSCAGWKYYGSGWFGHHMALEQHSLAVRVQFDQRIAVVVAAHDTSVSVAAMTLVRMFGRVLPEFHHMRIPRALSKSTITPDMAKCVGTYADRATAVRVTLDMRAGLQAEFFPNVAAFSRNAPQVRAGLKPGSDGTYLADSLALQFISLGLQGYDYLWNGRSVLRRIQHPID